MRFTQKEDALFATLMEIPAGREIELANLKGREGATVHLLGCVEPLAWAQEANRLSVHLPDTLPESVAHSLKISPQPIMCND